MTAQSIHGGVEGTGRGVCVWGCGGLHVGVWACVHAGQPAVSSLCEKKKKGAFCSSSSQLHKHGLSIVLGPIPNLRVRAAKNKNTKTLTCTSAKLRIKVLVGLTFNMDHLQQFF